MDGPSTCDWKYFYINGHMDVAIYSNIDNVCSVAVLSTMNKWSIITPEILARRWEIRLSTVKRALKATTQVGIRNVMLPSDQKIRVRTKGLQFLSWKNASIWTLCLQMSSKSNRTKWHNFSPMEGDMIGSSSWISSTMQESLRPL